MGGSLVTSSALRLLRAALCLAWLPGAAMAQTAPWMTPDLLPAAKAEGSVTVYSSVNEAEGLPLWKIFEDATGIKVSFVRASDVQLNGRIAIEHRARQQSWDLTITTAVSQLPPEVLAPYEPPEAASLDPSARAKDRRWYASSANYNTPAYNTKLVAAADLPTSFEDFATRAQWRGRVAIDGTDIQWLSAMFQHYGEDKARKLLRDLIGATQPVIVDGHLALARSLGAGEYLLALNNFTNLTYNVASSGAPTDIFALDPVAVFMVQVGVSSQAPHPNAARLAANFAISQEAQAFGANFGRLPVRADVTPNPPDALTRLKGRTIVPVVFGPEDERKWKRQFDELFRPR